jgi:hypothetical protein
MQNPHLSAVIPRSIDVIDGRFYGYDTHLELHAKCCRYGNFCASFSANHNTLKSHAILFISAESLTRFSCAALAVRGSRNFVTTVQTPLCDSHNSHSLFIILSLS